MDLERLGRRWEKGLAHQTRTSLSRSIDPRVPSNVFAVVLAVVSGGVVLALRLSDDWDLAAAFGNAFGAGLASFLAWALGRELDPDDTLTAGVAGVAVAVLWVASPASPALTFALLLAARLLARTTGPPPRRADLVVAIAVAAYVSLQPAGAMGAVAIAAALWIGRLIGPDDHERSPWAALAALVAGATAAAVADVSLIETSDRSFDGAGLGILAASALALPFQGLRGVEARADYTGEALDVRRVVAARVVTAAAVLGAAALAGPTGITRATGGASVLVAIALARLVNAARR